MVSSLSLTSLDGWKPLPQLPSLKLTAKAPENRQPPNRKIDENSIPTIHFQGLCSVSLREGNGKLVVWCPVV